MMTDDATVIRSHNGSVVRMHIGSVVSTEDGSLILALRLQFPNFCSAVQKYL